MMRVSYVFSAFCLLSALAGTAPAANPQIAISGVGDKQTYSRQVEFTVLAEPGYSFGALLDGRRIAVGQPVRVTTPDYHQLLVSRTNSATLEATNHQLQFIIFAPERGSTEIGLPPWIPHDDVPSAEDELAGAQFRAIAPRRFPAGHQIPLAFRVENNSGQRLPVNGTLGSSAVSLAVRRGVGSGFLPASDSAGPLEFDLAMAGHSVNVGVNVETNTAWLPLSGTVAPNATWPPNSRILITGDMTNAPGNTLTVGAGSMIRLIPGVNIYNSGNIVIDGTPTDPVIFMPAIAGQLWGGFVQHASNASLTATGTIFTGSGAEPCWFRGHGCSSSISGLGSHRGEQALVSLKGANCNLTFTDCAAFGLGGQFGHSTGGSGNSYRIQLTRFLMQRATTGGEFTDASFSVNDSAFIECPVASPEFVDGDNDALYLVNGIHGFTNTLFGWTKDDGIDSGASGGGVFLYENCWFESIFHEANSLSGSGKQVTHYRSVFLNNGQGLESGYDSPSGTMVECFAGGNVVGARFGDNYDWSYNGFLRVTNSILLQNHRDVWGLTWNNWTYNTNRMDIRGNLLTHQDPWWPDNKIWNPDSDAGLLARFLPMEASAPVGVAFSLRGKSTPQMFVTEGVPIRLSRFSSLPVTVICTITTPGHGSVVRDLSFTPGETVKQVPISDAYVGESVLVGLSAATNGRISGPSLVLLAPALASGRLGFVRFGNELALHWSDESALEGAPSPVGPWTRIETTSPHLHELTETTRFFRLRAP